MVFVFFGVVVAIVVPSCIAVPPCAVEPIKVPLVTTAIPSDTRYILAGKPPGLFDQDEENPTKTLTLGGIECVVKAEMPGKASIKNGLPCKLLCKTPTQEFTATGQSMEFTLDHGRKYLLTGEGFFYSDTDPENKKKNVRTFFKPAGVQTGKIGQTSIALYDSNMDGFYTIGEDGIAFGPPMIISLDWLFTKKYHYVQPLSKYISTSDGIFEIRNLAKDGSELTLLPYNGPTASLEVIAPQSNSGQKYFGQIILTSPDANLNVTVSGKAGESVAVIPGEYKILIADLKAARSTMYISGAGMSALKVKAGEKQVMVLSGPKRLEFQAAMIGGKININPETFHIKGQAGEIYSGVHDRSNLPEVYLNVDGKSTLLGKMEYG